MIALALVFAPLQALAVGSRRSAVALSVTPMWDDKGTPRAISRPAILVFWRADCAPCMLELSRFEALHSAAGSDPVVAVGLQARDALRRGAAKIRVAPRALWRTDADPTLTLIIFGGAPPRLPLATALNRAGEICGVRHGMLGTRLAATWARTCGR